VSLRASVFVRLPTRVATQPVVAAQKPTEATAERKPAVEERLRNLDKLKQDGLINQAEYDRKRQEILDDI
jgi:cytochrome c-type biogenesis protein CcmH/NrfG